MSPIAGRAMSFPSLLVALSTGACGSETSTAASQPSHDACEPPSADGGCAPDEFRNLLPECSTSEDGGMVCTYVGDGKCYRECKVSTDCTDPCAATCQLMTTRDNAFSVCAPMLPD